jgi:hypothetical protein
MRGGPPTRVSCPAAAVSRFRIYSRQVAQRDWVEWHSSYLDPSSPLSRRLTIVKGHLKAELDHSPAGAIEVVSICAGQGRDLFEVLSNHPRRGDVQARLVEWDRRNVEIARRSSTAMGLPGIEVAQADAGTTDSYIGAVPARIVLACGLFGNISDDDIVRTVAALPSLCAPEALVVWTRPNVRSWFEEAGFAEEAFDAPEGTYFGVGAHRLVSEPQRFTPGRRLFSFVGYDKLDPRSEK